MRLRRVEAIRYGGLSDALLEEFGDGLTVVLGPNEAGKSTFTALVRHLLYGFPKRNAKEASYAPRAGDRHGRLVFEGDHGVWALERVDGVHGGPVSVRTLRGADYPGQLRDDLVSGVSESAYRVVFGFGLSDLAAIEQMRDSGDDIVGRLYSAGTGVAVNPVEVRARLLDSAGAIWAPGATRRRLNTLLAERDELRVRLQALAAEAETFAADRARLETLDAEVETARVQRDRFEVTSRDTSRAVEQVEARAIELAGAEAALLEARAEVEREGAALAGVVPDGRVLGAAPEIEAVLADLSGHRDRMERLAAAEAELAQIDGRVAAERAALGGPAGAAPGIQLGQSEEVEEWRTRLERVALRADESRRAARDGEAASRVAARTDESSGARPGPTAAYAMFAFGAVAVAVGAFIGQWPMWLMGLLLLATGALFLFSRVRVTVSGTTPGTTPGTEELTASARLAAQRASDDAGDVESARGEWAAWLVSAGLRPGITPAEAAAVVSAGKAIAALENDRAVRAEALASERATARRTPPGSRLWWRSSSPKRRPLRLRRRRSPLSGYARRSRPPARSPASATRPPNACGSRQLA